jgi:hypothetical protein
VYINSLTTKKTTTRIFMSALVKFEDKKYDIEYYKSLVNIAMASTNYNMKPEAMLNIMMTAKDLGISPLKALNGGFYLVNGKISMSTALMADRIRKEGHSIKIPEWTSEKCVIIGQRKDNGDSVKFEFTMQDAQTAGLTGSPTWKKFPKQMLYNRAMSTLARTLFPDVVGNCYSEDEKHDIMGVSPEKRPLEDPDAIVLENSVVMPSTLSDEQVNNIMESLSGDDDRLSKLLEFFSVKKLSEVPSASYEKIMKTIQKKKVVTVVEEAASDIS